MSGRRWWTVTETIEYAVPAEDEEAIEGVVRDGPTEAWVVLGVTDRYVRSEIEEQEELAMLDAWSTRNPAMPAGDDDEA